MFYTALGSLIGQSGELLAERSARSGAAGGDARDERELRQIGLLLRRARGVWTDLFRTLEEELEVLTEALAEVNATLEAQSLPPVPVASESDSIGRYRETERAIDAALGRLLDHRDTAWSRAARRALRARLAEAAAIQGRLTDGMLAIR